MSDPLLDRRYMLGGVVTTVDAQTGIATLKNHKECEKQAAVADRLVITKTDLNNSPDPDGSLGELQVILSALNPTAIVLDRHNAEFDYNRLFDTSLFDPDTKSINVRSWLKAEESSDHDTHDDNHSHDHDHHDVTRHGSDIRSFTLTFEEPVTIEAFASSLEALSLIHI